MSVPASELSFELSPDMHAVNEAAMAHGVELDAERLQQLDGLVRDARESQARFGADVGFNDKDNGVQVGPTSGLEYPVEAPIDFMPKVGEFKDQEGNGAATAQTDHASRVAHMGIRGVQNYVLLAEAGIITRPDLLYGSSNASMISVCRRIGISPTQTLTPQEIRARGGTSVEGYFSTVRDRVFSDEVRRLDAALVRRLATRSMGDLTVRQALS